MSYLDRGFGIEIECFMPEGSSREQLAAAINQRLGRPDAAFLEGYGHTTRPFWKVTTDGSLLNYRTGVEVVSPVLKGLDGLAEAERVCRALADYGCTVNKKCGFHVHVGVGPRPTMKFWKDVISTYAVFENVIDKMMPASRRAGQNNYCRALTNNTVSNYQACNTFSDLCRSVRGLSELRYHKVNLAAYERHGTVEFRQHSGTTDAVKVRNWIVICLKMVERAAQENFNTGSFGARPRNYARVGTKNHMIGEMLLRPEGITSQEALAATGWTTVSVPEIARFCGIGFTAQKTGRMTRYFSRNTAVAATAETFAAYIGLSSEEAAYVNQRTNDLSGAVAWAA